MCDTQHKYLPFGSGVHGTKTNPKKLQYVQYDSENWQQWVQNKKQIIINSWMAPNVQHESVCDPRASP